MLLLLQKKPVASAFMYKRLIYYIVTILIGLKPSNLSDAKNKTKTSNRFTKESLNDEGGVIAGHTIAFNGVQFTLCFTYASNDMGSNRTSFASRSCRHRGCTYYYF